MAEDQKPQEMSISELAERAQVTPRTIRYYIAQGILPPPPVQGRYATYESWYLDRLELIALLKAAFLPLKEIQARINKLSNTEVSRILRAYRANHNTSGQDIFALITQNSREADDQPANEMESRFQYEATITAPRETRESALDYLNSIERAETAPAPDPLNIRQRIRARVPEFDLNETRWIRLRIADGIELHVREDLYLKDKRLIEQAIADFLRR
ncbi:MAG: MerR family transcriptional regulator [Anaerolineaceae bacterium]|nr:MerR family transcriptional regulator [Anaerolineaceae bacterium]